MYQLQQAQPLPCGASIPNRIAKSAMTEGLADTFNRATLAHQKLYQRWAQGGVGLAITGNVQIDLDHLERPGNIAICGPQSEAQLQALRLMAQAGSSGNNHLWMQLSHAGRQTQAIINPHPFAPSAIPLDLPKAIFGTPRALNQEQILELIQNFAHAASIAKQTGFSGVQIHSAHGYLLSSFLSPKANQRSDQWGGSLENRARCLLETIRAVRSAVGPDFPIGVKLNSADFQEKGFSAHESIQVAKWLEQEGIDLLEISGGNYESAAMMGASMRASGEKKRESTKKREAYFLDYAENIRKAVSLPLMVTGGFRSRQAMIEAVASGDVDMIGLARPLCTETDLPQRLLMGRAQRAPIWEQRLGILKSLQGLELVRTLNGFGVQGWFCLQLIRMGQGQEPNLDMGVLTAFLRYMLSENNAAKAMKKARREALS